MKNWEGGLAGDLLFWNRHPVQAGTREGARTNVGGRVKKIRPHLDDVTRVVEGVGRFPDDLDPVLLGKVGDLVVAGTGVRLGVDLERETLHVPLL